MVIPIYVDDEKVAEAEDSKEDIVEKVKEAITTHGISKGLVVIFKNDGTRYVSRSPEDLPDPSEIEKVVVYRIVEKG